jgi:hypothetical protein
MALNVGVQGAARNLQRRAMKAQDVAVEREGARQYAVFRRSFIS